MGRRSLKNSGMLILYRTSPYLSTNPNPLGTYKLGIVERCFESFKKANNGSKIIVIADGFTDEEKDNLFKGCTIIEGNHGNIETFHQQLDLVCNLDNDEKVMIVEDDYLWVEGAIDQLEKALDVFEIVSPYDHPAHYLEPRFKDNAKRMVLVNGHTYRDCPSNTLTFATKAYVIKQNIDKIKPFGIRDHELFESLTQDKWCAVPALATHLVTGLLSPNVDWKL